MEKFNVKELKTLFQLLSENEVTEFRLEREGEKLWLKRGVEPAVQQTVINQAPMSAPVHAPVVHAEAPATQAAVSADAAAPQAAPAGEIVAPPAVNRGGKEVKSPMVGTFYRRPAVDADPYVAVGDKVKKGQVLCIVEAMKVMNEIESEMAGTVAEICLEDGQMVEYGEVIFRIDPS